MRLHQARELALPCGARALAAHLDLALAACSLDRFAIQDASMHANRCSNAARQLGLTLLSAAAATVQALLRATEQDEDGVGAATAEAIACAGHDPAIAGVTWSAWGLLTLLREERGPALRHFERAAELFASLPTAPLMPTRAIYLLLVQNEPDSARTAAVLAEADGGWWSTHHIARGYLRFAEAIQFGRAGRTGDASARAGEAVQALARADGWRRCAYRLVAADAIADGWGEPARWLREALAYFEEADLPRAADACRAQMRAAALPVPRRDLAGSRKLSEEPQT